MSLGIISDEEFDSELKESNSSVEIRQIERGRGQGNTAVPPIIREIISESAIEGTPAKILSAEFGISPSSISAYKVGATSTSSYHNPDRKLAEKNGEVREKITQRATRRIMMALSSITKDRIETAKLRDISSLAKDMSAVVKNLEGQNARLGLNNSGPTFIFYTPRVRKEEEYEIITVNED